jgi:hypothetical protein
MVRKSRAGTVSRASVAEPFKSGDRPKRPVPILTTHALLTEAWTGQVQTIELAIRRFKPDHSSTNDCEVVFFEIPGDRQLHVNVTHKYPTKGVAGWAGPGSVPSGFVYNRRFSDTRTGQLTRHIREMVLAARV